MGQLQTKLRELGNDVRQSQKEMMQEIQEEMMQKQLKRQLNMQNAMRERQIAMQIGVARERFEYMVGSKKSETLNKFEFCELGFFS